MFTNYNWSILRQHTVKKNVFVFYRVSKDYHSHNFNNCGVMVKQLIITVFW